MTTPAAITLEDGADAFVDTVIDQLFNGSGNGGSEDQDKDSADANTPPNFWLGPINVGPVSFGKQIDDPVTSGSDSAGEGPVGTVDTPGESK
jgi:hypothetical protein